MGEERNSKSNDGPRADIISNLRRDVINCIIERLPLRDAARMCVLSHKWRYAWTSTPQLVFDAQFFSSVLRNKGYSDVNHKFYGTVSKILFLHDGPILKFSLCVPSQLYYIPDVSEWVSFLSRNGIRDFSLHNYCKSYLKLSLHLISCVWLENLYLLRCELRIPCDFVGFRKLVTLELVRVVLDQDTFEHLIAGCSLLEKLSLTNCRGIEHFNVNIAPNLRHLTVVGTSISLCVKNADDVLSASIAYEKLVNSLRNFIEVSAKSTKLEKLGFGGRFCKVLFKSLLWCPTFENLRSLELSSLHLNDTVGFSAAIRAIQSCPNVEKLDISVTKVEDVDDEIENGLGYDSSFKLLRLRNITVRLQRGFDVELKLIEFLLACSLMVEILSLEVNGEVDSSEKSRIIRKLKQFHKASPKMTMLVSMSKTKSDSSYNTINSASESSSDSESDSSEELSSDDESE